eukprot:m.7149 g.7149  ORF g.7149 m.7149 type:complete len:268 (-) comp3653_c0_seq1:1661-2464(-)
MLHLEPQNKGSHLALLVVLNALGVNVLGAIFCRIPSVASLQKACVERKWKEHLWQEWINSLVHALVCTIYIVPVLYLYEQRPISTRYTCIWNPETRDTPELYFFALFLGHICSDLIWEYTGALRGLTSPDWETRFHHSLFIGICLINWYYMRWCYMMSYLCFGEISTVFLSIRKLMIACGRTEHIGPVNILFALTFFIGRMVFYPYALYNTLMYEGEHVFQDWSIWQVCPIGVIAGLFLNIFWMGLILKLGMADKKVNAKVGKTSVD